MNTLESHKELLRRIADEMMASRKPSERRPLSRVQEYLEEIEHCVEKLTRILLKVKDLALVVKDLVILAALVSVFVWDVIDLLIRLGR